MSAGGRAIPVGHRRVFALFAQGQTWRSGWTFRHDFRPFIPCGECSTSYRVGHPVGANDSAQQARWWGPGGDIIRRLVARSLAKHITKKVEAMTAPFQYALSTKAGCDCVSHILQSMTDLDPDMTITSIDTIFIGRETKPHILQRKMNEKKNAKVSPSNNNYSFRII